MSLLTFILQNLKYYRKSYLGVLAGTVISTAVLTGALVVGDSVRYSLGQLTDIRLGKSRFAIPANDRFFRQGLAVELASKTNSAVAPILHLEGMAMNTVNNISINHAEVLGMDERFMKLWDITGQIADDQAILSRNTADKLGLKPGDEILLKVSTRSKASANAPFIPEKEPLKMLRLKISAIADNEKMGQFSLKTNQSAPYNIFVSLKTLSLKVGL